MDDNKTDNINGSNEVDNQTPVNQGAPAGIDDNNKENEPESEEKTFTQAEVKKMIDERLARERAKAEEKAAEVKKLARMNAEQKQQYEIEKANKRAEEAEAKLARLEMRGQARNMLAEANINASDDDLDLIVTDNAETTKTNVDKLKTIIERERENVRKELLAGKTPKINGNNVKAVTKQQFDLMSSKQRTALYHENPQLFKKLTGGI